MARGGQRSCRGSRQEPRKWDHAFGEGAGCVDNIPGEVEQATPSEDFRLPRPAIGFRVCVWWTPLVDLPRPKVDRVYCQSEFSSSVVSALDSDVSHPSSHMVKEGEVKGENRLEPRLRVQW